MQERTAFGVAGVTEASSQWNHDACLEQKGAAAESSRAGMWGETGRDGERRGDMGRYGCRGVDARGGGARGARAWSAAARAVGCRRCSGRFASCRGGRRCQTSRTGARRRRAYASPWEVPMRLQEGTAQVLCGGGREITGDHGRSREIAGDHGRSRQVAGDRGRSREITAGRGRSREITKGLARALPRRASDHGVTLECQSEIWGDVGRCGELWGDLECQSEIWGDLGSSGEISSASRRARICSPRLERWSGAPRPPLTWEIWEIWEIWGDRLAPLSRATPPPPPQAGGGGVGVLRPLPSRAVRKAEV